MTRRIMRRRARQRRRWRVVLIALAALAAPSSGDGTATDELARARACVEANTPRVSCVLEATLRSEDGRGGVGETRFKLTWRRLPDGERRALIRFTAPEALDGAALLIQGIREARPEVHLYLPDLGAPRRVTSREQLSGFLGRADLGLEEIGLLLDPVGDPDLRLLDAVREVRGRPTWVLEALGDGDAGARYQRTLTFVDQELCVALRAEFYQSDAAQPLEMEVDPEDVRQEAGSWIPREMVFSGPRDEEVRTLRLDRVEVDAAVAPSLLTVPALDLPGVTD